MFDKVFEKLNAASNESDEFAIQIFREVTCDLERIGVGWLEIGKLLSNPSDNRENVETDNLREQIIAQESFGEIIWDYRSCNLKPKQLRFLEGVEKFWIRNQYITNKQVVTTCEILGHEEYAEAVAQYVGHARPEWVAEFKLGKRKKLENSRRAHLENIAREQRLIDDAKSILKPLRVPNKSTNHIYFDRWKTLVPKLPYGLKPPSVSLQNYKAALNGAGSKSGRVAIALIVGKKPSELFIGSRVFGRRNDRSEEDLMWLEFLSLRDGNAT
jgi:hypothetical protein